MQRLKRSGRKPAKPRKKPAKTPQKPAKNRKNPQILKSRCFGNFRIFLEFQKFFTVCVHGRSAEIFPETYMFGTFWNKVNHFLGHLTYLLRTTIFSSAVEGRGIYTYVYMYICKICIYVNMYMYICKYVYMSICICIYVYMYMYICKYVYMSICIYVARSAMYTYT